MKNRHIPGLRHPDVQLNGNFYLEELKLLAVIAHLRHTSSATRLDASNRLIEKSRRTIFETELSLTKMTTSSCHVRNGLFSTTVAAPLLTAEAWFLGRRDRKLGFNSDWQGYSENFEGFRTPTWPPNMRVRRLTLPRRAFRWSV